jgi:hypothetical protein
MVIRPRLGFLAHRGIQAFERDFFFSKPNVDLDLDLMHNDFTLSNTIADNGKIGIVTGRWPVSLGGRLQPRSIPSKSENYAHLNLPDDLIENILFWNDLYMANGVLSNSECLLSGEVIEEMDVYYYQPKKFIDLLNTWSYITYSRDR